MLVFLIFDFLLCRPLDSILIAIEWLFGSADVERQGGDEFDPAPAALKSARRA